LTEELLKAFNDMLSEREEQESLSLNDRVLIIDGMNTFIRSFAAIPTMDDNGNHIGGVTGFLRSVAFAIRQVNPTRVYVIFDGKGGSKRRRDIYPEYKAGRKPVTRLNRAYDMTTEQDEKDLMKRELVIVAKSLLSLPITTITLDHVEADDIMSYIATHTAEQGGQSILYSTDKDFLQLVNDNITIWHPMKKKTYTTDLVLEEHKIHPNNFLLYRSLIGDNSDNISGIKGIGTKTLLKHMPQFAEEQKITLDELMDTAKANKSKVMQKIVDNKDIIERNLYLMSLESANMSDINKMKVLNRINESEVILDKPHLTNLLEEYNILPAIQNYNFWLQQTFLPLMRFNGRL